MISSLATTPLRPGEPYTTVLLGKTGVGKTSTLRALFGWDWPTDPVVACTRQPSVGLLDRRECPSLARPLHRVVDLAGLGESLQADVDYLPAYRQWVAAADVLLWVTQADTRAFKRDQLLLGRLRPSFRPGLVFKLGVNQVDRLGVAEGEEGFDQAGRRPSAAQLRQLRDRVDDLLDLFREALGEGVPFERSDIIPYAAVSGWNLDGLRRLFFRDKE